MRAGLGRKMGYYVNRKVHFDGDLILYQRNLQTAVPNVKTHRLPTWYMKLKVGGARGYIERSTKLTKYEDAYEFARTELYRIRNAVKLGHTLDDFTFEQHWTDWFQRNQNVNTWKVARQRWHSNYAKRYFFAYFRNADGSSMYLNDITADVAHGFWQWRIAYWSTQAGVKLTEHNPKRRKAKTTSTHNVALAPAKKTLQMEQSALNQIFWDARERGRLQQVFKLKAPTDHRPHNRRPHFQDSEHLSLVRYLLSYRDCVGAFKDDKLNAWHKLKRQQLYHFVIFMLNSGLRVGEAREMRWRDIQFDQQADGLDELIAVVGVRKNTKTGVNRDVQAQPMANKTLKEWLAITPHSGPNDLVWFGQLTTSDGKATPFTNLNKSFQTFLSRLPIAGASDGLLFSKEGEKRSLYSLRHTYATQRRKHGIRWEDLSLNMGCGIKQLRDHYDHSTSNSRRDDIVMVKRRATLVPDAVDPMPAFIANALKLYQSGVMDEATFLGIAKMQAPAA